MPVPNSLGIQPNFIPKIDNKNYKRSGYSPPDTNICTNHSHRLWKDYNSTKDPNRINFRTPIF
jgi:hypothetical protein